MKVLLATPTVSGIDKASYAHTLFGAAMAVRGSGAEVEFIAADGRDVAAAKNFFANLLLRRPDISHLVVIDSDMSFDGDVVLRLLRSGKPVVGATYPKPRMDLQAYAQAARDPELGLADLAASALQYEVQVKPGTLAVVDGFCRAERIALGCAAIRRDALEGLIAAGVARLHPDSALRSLGLEGPFYDFFSRIPREDGDRLSEDHSFCERWLGVAGNEIWALVDAPVGRAGVMVHGADAPFLNRLRLAMAGKLPAPGAPPVPGPTTAGSGRRLRRTYPFYRHCMRHAAVLARKLGHRRISAIEFGVAGGNGLVAMERHAEAVQAETGVEVAVYGFDTGKGLPPPQDYRDIPYLWQPGYFAMDVPKLQARLRSAKLILGDVAETVREFVEREEPPPVGFIAFDLDYYSSTTAALKILEAGHRHLLPRTACYFDDTVGDVDWAYNEFTGELLAIKEFNATHEHMKIAPVNGLRFVGGRDPQPWHEQVFVAHMFTHPDYNRPISEITQLPLAED
jgi:hypothetical protein